jgi:hypothetical protein
MSGRQDKTRGASLKALAGMPIASRFCSWIGQSGRRYVFSVYPASECPAFPDAVLMAVVRDMAWRRCVVSVRDTGAFPEPVVVRVLRELRTFGPGLELHLHLLAASSAERAATVADWRLPGTDAAPFMGRREAVEALRRHAGLDPNHPRV